MTALENGAPAANSIVESCASTNDLARRLAEAGAAHGTWISARTQTGGRGRLGRQWQSLGGNLFLSIIARPGRDAHWSLIPLTAALAVAESVQAIFPLIPTRVKWPNDLWVGGAKLGGILCEAVGNRSSSSHSADAFVVIGIGLNCAASPQGLEQPTTNLSAESGRSVVADDVRGAITASVLRWMDLNPERIARAYEEMAALPPGTRIEWADGSRHGEVLGLGPSGELRVRSEGHELPLLAEDVKIRPVR